MCELRREARQIAQRVAARERVVLRRWLRRYHDEEGIDLPESLYLTYGAPDLAEFVRDFGGDPDAMLEEARRDIVDAVAGEEE